MNTQRFDGALIRFYDEAGNKVGTIGLPVPAFDELKSDDGQTGVVLVSRPFTQWPNPGGKIHSALMYLSDGTPPFEIGIGLPGSGAFLKVESEDVIPGLSIKALPMRLMAEVITASLEHAIRSGLPEMAIKGTAEVRRNGELVYEE